MRCLRSVDLQFTFLLESPDYSFLTAFLTVWFCAAALGAFDIGHNDQGLGRFANAFPQYLLMASARKA